MTKRCENQIKLDTAFPNETVNEGYGIYSKFISFNKKQYEYDW